MSKWVLNERGGMLKRTSTFMDPLRNWSKLGTLSKALNLKGDKSIAPYYAWHMYGAMAILLTYYYIDRYYFMYVDTPWPKHGLFLYNMRTFNDWLKQVLKIVGWTMVGFFWALSFFFNCHRWLAIVITIHTLLWMAGKLIDVILQLVAFGVDDTDHWTGFPNKNYWKNKAARPNNASFWNMLWTGMEGAEISVQFVIFPIYMYAAGIWDPIMNEPQEEKTDKVKEESIDTDDGANIKEF
jgi:hypothetical protein